MKIAVTGKENGHLAQRLIALGAVPLRSDVLDIKACREEIKAVRPDVIIHAAAITDVEACRRDYERAIVVNMRGTNNVCEAASDILGDGRVVLLSTDHVFDGTKGNYKEDDEPNPITEYGMTKHGAEAVVRLYDGKIVRLSKCFDKNDKEVVSIFSQKKILLPTFIKRSFVHLDYIAVGLIAYAKRFDEMPPILHLAGTETISYYQFARYIEEASMARGEGLFFDIRPRDYELDGYAPRPYNCGLDVSLANSLELPLYSPIQSVQRLFMY
jgi:dTDP-4-dehydrorhamnose reductase